MKGISAVIATILLLLITISIIGFAFVFFGRVTTTTTQSVENQTNQQLIQFSKQINVDNFNLTSVTIRATGTGTIGSSELQIYVDGSPRTCSPALTSITPGTVQTCNFSPGCSSGSKLRVVSPANSIDINC